MTALRTHDGLPVLHAAAMQGFAGEVVSALAPYTEASDVGVLATLLAGTGAMLGAGPHMQAGGRHSARVWPLLIGGTSTGRKGTAVNIASNVLYAADGEFMTRRRTSGLSTGEGIIQLVRDPGEPTDEDRKREATGKPPTRDMGAPDKRALIVEHEFARVLAASKRENSTLSAVLREAWDGGPLSILTKQAPLRATNHHLVVVGCITPTELRVRLTDVEVSNGLVNRFLLLRVQRSKLLPDGDRAPDDLFRALGRDLHRRVRVARDNSTRFRRTAEAVDYWRALYLGPLNPENEDDGLLSQAISRAAPQVVRLSLLYAVLDGRPEVDVEHLAAAAALWDYSVASARLTFSSAAELGEADDLQRLSAFVREAGPGGRTRTEIAALFQRKKTVDELDVLRVQLLAGGSFIEGPPPSNSKHGVLMSAEFDAGSSSHSSQSAKSAKPP